MDDINNEIDSSIVYKQAVSNLSTLTNLSSSLNHFGYKEDDRIERRDVILIYNTIRNEMKEEINSLAHSSLYSNAKEMRNRLNLLTNEFNSLQTNSSEIIRNEQQNLFLTAKSQHFNEIKERHLKEEEEVRNYCEDLRNDLIKTHQIERENLELKINQIKKLPTVYSKRLIELLKSESR